MSSARDKFVAFAFCWADALIELDQSRRILFATGATRAMVGAKPETLIGRDFHELVDLKDRVLVDQLLAMTTKRARIHDVEIHMVSPDGKNHPVKFAGYVLPDLKDHHFLALRATVPLNEVGEEEDGVERDKESGLLTSDSFSARAAEQLRSSAASGAPAEMTLVNLPGFDAFFEKLSPDDQQVFRNTVGTTLRANSIDGNSAGEIGDGKFGLVHAKGMDVTALEQTLSEATKAFDRTGKGIEVQAGTVAVDMTAVNEEDLTKGLVYTINHFKEQVGDKFNVKDIAQNMDGLVKEAMQSLNKFRNIVGGNDFQIAFHPILHVRTGAVHHYEALVRFNGKFEESPYKQITFAEETGLIAEFDIAMAKKCVEWLRKNRADRVSIAVNISGNSVDNQPYIKELHTLLDADTWLKDFLLFEITESARVADLNQANTFVQSLRGRGFHVCLDDFGAGAASFQYLSTLEVDVVKLDGSAVKNAQAAPKGRAFLRALTTLCKTLKVETIAEMVDSKESLEFVRDCGVEYVQGFLFGKPDPDPWGFIKKLDRRLFS
ncbi:MAG: EAL domain-containing protein [Rhodospirillaceae bacterium]|nr:MAG: EAL domain-containing protein [Rhodospirillaceae bacterium]